MSQWNKTHPYFQFVKYINYDDSHIIDAFSIDEYSIIPDKGDKVALYSYSKKIDRKLFQQFTVMDKIFSLDFDTPRITIFVKIGTNIGGPTMIEDGKNFDEYTTSREYKMDRSDETLYDEDFYEYGLLGGKDIIKLNIKNLMNLTEMIPKKFVLDGITMEFFRDGSKLIIKERGSLKA